MRVSEELYIFAALPIQRLNVAVLRYDGAVMGTDIHWIVEAGCMRRVLEVVVLRDGGSLFRTGVETPIGAAEVRHKSRILSVGCADGPTEQDEQEVDPEYPL